MKKIFLTSAVVFIFMASVLNANGQNSVDLRWGHFVPLNGKFSDAFNNSNAFSIGLLHPLSNSGFSVGITFSHQHFQSRDSFFKNGYSSKFSIHNYLITGRYDFINNPEFKLYAAADAGLNKSRNEENTSGVKKEIKNTGITTVVSFGGEVALSRRVWLGANIQSQDNYLQTIWFNDQFSINNATSVAANIGIRWLLGTKRNN